MKSTIGRLHVLIAVYLYTSLVFISCTRAQNVSIISIGNIVLYMSRLALCASADTTPLINPHERTHLNPLDYSIIKIDRSRNFYDRIPTTSTGINRSTEPFEEEIIVADYDFYKEVFDNEVYNKEFDLSFIVPSLDIADSKEIRSFLKIVGACYKKLVYRREEKKLEDDFLYTFCCKKIKIVTPPPKPRIAGITKSQVEQDILDFMKNANEMAFKLMIELNIIMVGSRNFILALQSWANMKWKREKCALTPCELISSYKIVGEGITIFLNRMRI